MSNTTPNSQAPRASVAFAALDPYVEVNIPKPTETVLTGRDRVKWGTGDKYPDYLLGLYERSATLRGVIDGCVDYIAGDDVLFQGKRDHVLNRYGETALDIVRQLAMDLKRVGGFAIQVVRDNGGRIAEVFALEMRYVRTNKDATVFYYSERWGRSNANPVTMPAFMSDLTEKWATLEEKERDRHASSVVYYRADRLHTYPTPCYLAAVPSCEIEANIDDFHLNSLENGFTASAIINFYNGIPTDQEKEEMERNVNEKFSGHRNAARIMLNFADSKQNGADIKEFAVSDFGERFGALEKTSKQKIFTAFRAHPALFGIPTETDSLNLASEDYDQVFKLFNRTQIRPAQRAITDAFAKIYGAPVLQVIPFTLDGAGEASVA